MTNSPQPTRPANDPDADITEVIGTTPTTAEEAMDAESESDGFVDESAYAPTDT